MLDLLKLKTFLVVAATSSFTRAGAKLGYSQSSVTTHIQSLERELGVSLFERFGKKVLVTEIGRQMMDYANRLLALAEEAKATARERGNLSGPLSVGAPEAVITYRFPEVLRQFQTIHPHVHVSIAPRSDSQTQVEEILDGTLDLAVIAGELVHSEKLITSCLGSEEILIVKSPDYEFVSSEFSRGKTLQRRGSFSPTRTAHFGCCLIVPLTLYSVPLADTMELGSIEAAKQCAIAGMGLAVLPRMAATPELKRKRLVSVPWPGTGFPVYLQLIRHRERWASPALVGLWELAEQNLARAA